MQQFASDNNAGMCPEALEAMLRANAGGHATSYGADEWTELAKRSIAEIFETDCEVFFVFNGTAANALSLAQISKPWHATICHAISHIETDEAGAPEFLSGGSKLMAADGADGKLSPSAVETLATRWQGFHHVKARALSLTQATEVGTVYSSAELRALTETAQRHDLVVHMDGARLANAIAHLECAPAEITWKAGVDILSFGGTKNGLAIGEAVVFFKKQLATEFEWRVKQSGQLASKMRLITAPWHGILQNGAWLRHASHANRMAQRLAAAISSAPAIRIMHPVEANAVFADIPPAVQSTLRAKGWKFYTFLGETGCRLMCAWDTEPATVDRFAEELLAATHERR